MRLLGMIIGVGLCALLVMLITTGVALVMIAVAFGY